MKQELIDQLETQAWNDVPRIDGGLVLQEDWIRTYTELILRECMTLTENYSRQFSSESAAERIAEYFGLEQ